MKALLFSRKGKFVSLVLSNVILLVTFCQVLWVVVSFTPYSNSPSRTSVSDKDRNLFFKYKKSTTYSVPTTYSSMKGINYNTMESLKRKAITDNKSDIEIIDKKRNDDDDDETILKTEVLVVGAGIAGLSFIRELERNDFSNYMLIESAKTLREGGTAIGLWTQAWKAMDYLELKEMLVYEDGNNVGDNNKIINSKKEVIDSEKIENTMKARKEILIDKEGVRLAGSNTIKNNIRKFFLSSSRERETEQDAKSLILRQFNPFGLSN